MPPRYSYRTATGSNYDRSSYFQLYTLDVITHAEEGSVGTATLHADDPAGTLDIAGHQKITITEDTATGSNTVTYVGFTGNREISRGDKRVLAAREWDITVTDANTLLSRRVFQSGEADRPAETDVARVNWAMTQAVTNEVQDESFIAQVNPADMDAVDYRGQTLYNILDDAAQQSGKNWFVWYNESNSQFGLWYDFAAGSNWTSPLRLSNYLTDIDSTWTFAISDDTKLTQDPSRVFSGVYLPYDGGAVYAGSAATASNFARRDAVMPAINVKTATKAKARAQRYLSDIATEEEVIRTTVIVPAERVNYLKAGMRVQLRASHLPGFEDWTWVRCITRQVRQISEQPETTYALTLELVLPVQPHVAASGVYGILYGSGGPYSTEHGVDLVYWANPGDTPGPGFEYRPTVGAISVLTDGTPPKDNRTHYGWQMTGSGMINVTFYATTVGVLTGSYTLTYSIRKNGAIVASDVTFLSGDLEFFSDSKSVTASGLVVTTGDLIEGFITSTTPKPHFFRTPAGTGQNGERLEITGGSLG